MSKYSARISDSTTSSPESRTSRFEGKAPLAVRRLGTSPLGFTFRYASRKLLRRHLDLDHPKTHVADHSSGLISCSVIFAKLLAAPWMASTPWRSAKSTCRP